MKKIIASLLIIAALAICAQAQTYDMESYGTTASITNEQTVGATTYKFAAITYDAACTNAITLYAKVDGINYLIGYSSITNKQYDYISLNAMPMVRSNALVITTTITNVNVRMVR